MACSFYEVRSWEFCEASSKDASGSVPSPTVRRLPQDKPLQSDGLTEVPSTEIQA